MRPCGCLPGCGLWTWGAPLECYAFDYLCRQAHALALGCNLSPLSRADFAAWVRLRLFIRHIRAVTSVTSYGHFKAAEFKSAGHLSGPTAPKGQKSAAQGEGAGFFRAFTLGKLGTRPKP